MKKTQTPSVRHPAPTPCPPKPAPLPPSRLPHCSFSLSAPLHPPFNDDALPAHCPGTHAVPKRPPVSPQKGNWVTLAHGALPTSSYETTPSRMRVARSLHPHRAVLTRPGGCALPTDTGALPPLPCPVRHGVLITSFLPSASCKPASLSALCHSPPPFTPCRAAWWNHPPDPAGPACTASPSPFITNRADFSQIAAPGTSSLGGPGGHILPCHRGWIRQGAAWPAGSLVERVTVMLPLLPCRSLVSRACRDTFGVPSTTAGSTQVRVGGVLCYSCRIVNQYLPTHDRRGVCLSFHRDVCVSVLGRVVD